MGSKDQLETLSYPELLQRNKDVRRKALLDTFLKKFRIGGVRRQETFWIESRIVKPKTGSSWSLSNWRPRLPPWLVWGNDTKTQKPQEKTKIKLGLEELQLKSFIQNSKRIIFNWGVSDEKMASYYSILNVDKLEQFVRVKVINVPLASANIYDPSFRLVEQKVDLPATTDSQAINKEQVKNIFSNTQNNYPFTVVPFRPPSVYEFFGGDNKLSSHLPQTFSSSVDDIADDDDQAVDEQLEKIRTWYEVYQGTFKSDIKKQLINLNLDLRYVSIWTQIERTYAFFCFVLFFFLDRYFRTAVANSNATASDDDLERLRRYEEDPTQDPTKDPKDSSKKGIK